MNGLNKKGVSNDPFFRNISNSFDNNIPGYINSRARARIHGDYHMLIGFAKLAIFNFKGAFSEFNRAGQQYMNVELGLPGVYGD